VRRTRERDRLHTARDMRNLFKRKLLAVELKHR
jgi:hypothetical protein